MKWKLVWEEIKQIEGWLNYPVAKLLHVTAKKTPSTFPIVEIGSWKGRSTILLSKSSPACVYAIDPHVGSSEHHGLSDVPIDTFNEFLENIENSGVKDKIHVIRKHSKDALQDVPEKIGMLWIDGSHEYKDVYDDFLLWFPRLVEGGYVLFHDSKWPGVKRVLWEELYPCNKVSLVKRVEDTTYAMKKSSSNFIERLINQITLSIYQKHHQLKRLKRKVKKKIKNRKRK